MLKNKKGYTILEIIIVLAIMGVLTAVLVPSLLTNVQDTRAEKDTASMNELVSAIKIAMTDPDIYDEMLAYATHGNVSCYVDSGNEGTISSDFKVVTHPSVTFASQYYYTDDTRTKDETVYYAAGHMRGVTITFQPEIQNGDHVYVMKNGIINKFVQGDGSISGDNKHVLSNLRTFKTTGVSRMCSPFPSRNSYVYGMPNYKTNGTLETTNSGEQLLFNKLKGIIGPYIELESARYRNSEYTIFIHMPSADENFAGLQDSVNVYGQWNGKNLSVNAS